MKTMSVININMDSKNYTPIKVICQGNGCVSPLQSFMGSVWDLDKILSVDWNAYVNPKNYANYQYSNDICFKIASEHAVFIFKEEVSADSIPWEEMLKINKSDLDMDSRESEFLSIVLKRVTHVVIPDFIRVWRMRRESVLERQIT